MNQSQQKPITPFFSISRISNFWILWFAIAASNLADGIFKLALPLLAIRYTDSPAVVAGVAFVIRLPWLLFALYAGVLADRFDRRRMMVSANIIRMIVLSALVLFAVLDRLSLPLLYIVALALGIAETLADTASSSILPSVVDKQDLDRANARVVGAMTVTNEFIGPPLGGALAAVSLALAFSTSSVLYLAAALALWFMAGTFRPAVTNQRHIHSDMLTGLRFVWNHALLRALVIIVAVMNIGWSAWASIIALYMVAPGPGGLSEFGYGVMLTSIGIGGFAGTLLAVPLVNRFGRRWAIGADILGTFIMMMLPALTSNALFIGAAAVIGGIGGAMWSIVVSSIRQKLVPDDMQGRTGGVFRLFGYGALPLGAALAGVVAEATSITAVFACCAFLTLMLFVPFFRVITSSALSALD